MVLTWGIFSATPPQGFRGAQRESNWRFDLDYDGGGDHQLAVTKSVIGHTLFRYWLTPPTPARLYDRGNVLALRIPSIHIVIIRRKPGIAWY